MEKEKITIFLSHSHKDQDKVRKIRDILESLECEPLMFFLKCLDDKNARLEQFIKDEIQARNIFVYCKSKNAENSKWVKKELEYIKSFDEKRLYTIDIENDFSLSLISFLQTLVQILKKNRLFISYSGHDRKTVDLLIACLKNNGYSVNNAPTSMPAGCDYAQYIRNAIDSAVKEGIYVYICSERSINSRWCLEELRYAMSINRKDSLILPIIIDDGNGYSILPKELWGISPLLIHRNPTEIDLKKLIMNLNILTR